MIKNCVAIAPINASMIYLVGCRNICRGAKRMCMSEQSDNAKTCMNRPRIGHLFM